MTENTSHTRPYSGVIAHLKQAGLRPTRQRIALTKLLFEGENRHVTAEDLHAEARAAGVSVSLATIYNSLHQFTDAGIMREVVVEAGRSTSIPIPVIIIISSMKIPVPSKISRPS